MTVNACRRDVWAQKGNENTPAASTRCVLCSFSCTTLGMAPALMGTWLCPPRAQQPAAVLAGGGCGSRLLDCCSAASSPTHKAGGVRPGDTWYSQMPCCTFCLRVQRPAVGIPSEATGPWNGRLECHAGVTYQTAICFPPQVVDCPPEPTPVWEVQSETSAEFRISISKVHRRRLSPPWQSSLRRLRAHPVSHARRRRCLRNVRRDGSPDLQVVPVPNGELSQKLLRQ